MYIHVNPKPVKNETKTIELMYVCLSISKLINLTQDLNKNKTKQTEAFLSISISKSTRSKLDPKELDEIVAI